MSRAFPNFPTLKQQFQLFVGLLFDPLRERFALGALRLIGFGQFFYRDPKQTDVS